MKGYMVKYLVILSVFLGTYALKDFSFSVDKVYGQDSTGGEVAEPMSDETWNEIFNESDLDVARRLTVDIKMGGHMGFEASGPEVRERSLSLVDDEFVVTPLAPIEADIPYADAIEPVVVHTETVPSAAMTGAGTGEVPPVIDSRIGATAEVGADDPLATALARVRERGSSPEGRLAEFREQIRSFDERIRRAMESGRLDQAGNLIHEKYELIAQERAGLAEVPETEGHFEELSGMSREDLQELRRELAVGTADKVTLGADIQAMVDVLNLLEALQSADQDCGLQHDRHEAAVNRVRTEEVQEFSESLEDEAENYLDAEIVRGFLSWMSEMDEQDGTDYVANLFESDDFINLENGTIRRDLHRHLRRQTRRAIRTYLERIAEGRTATDDARDSSFFDIRAQIDHLAAFLGRGDDSLVHQVRRIERRLRSDGLSDLERGRLERELRRHTLKFTVARRVHQELSSMLEAAQAQAAAQAQPTQEAMLAQMAGLDSGSTMEMLMMQQLAQAGIQFPAQQPSTNQLGFSVGQNPWGGIETGMSLSGPEMPTMDFNFGYGGGAGQQNDPFGGYSPYADPRAMFGGSGF